MAYLSNADEELLSAYIDNQLAPTERSALEARLASEPQLRQALGDLRATVTMLREVEPVRPPRSFTLDPAQVQPVRSFWQLPTTWMRFGSALATLMLAITVTLDLRSGQMVATTASAPASNARVMETPPAEAAPMSAAAAAAEPTSAPDAAAASAEDELSLESAPPESSTKSVVDPTSASAADASADSSIQTENSGIDNPQTSSPDTVDLGSYQDEAPQEMTPLVRPLFVLQIALGAFAVILLLASFWATRLRRF